MTHTITKLATGLIIAMAGQPAIAQVWPPAPPNWSKSSNITWEQTIEYVSKTFRIYYPAQSNVCVKDSCLWTIAFINGDYPTTMDVTSRNGIVLSHNICILNADFDASTCRNWESGTIWNEIKLPDGGWDVVRKDLK